jgi:hypothetical protein
MVEITRPSPGTFQPVAKLARYTALRLMGPPASAGDDTVIATNDCSGMAEPSDPQIPNTGATGKARKRYSERDPPGRTGQASTAVEDPICTD